MLLDADTSTVARKLSAHLKKQSAVHLADYDTLYKQGFEIGWDFARFGLRPEIDAHGIHDGHIAGVRNFGNCGTVRSDLFTRKWLRLRGSANRRGRIFDPSVTAEFIRSISVKYCPITRIELIYPDHIDQKNTGQFDDHNIWTVDRVSNDGGYIEGNLAVMSKLANTAKFNFGFDEAREMAIAAERERDGRLNGLTGPQWARVAALCALSDPHPCAEEVIRVPMLTMLPPKVSIRNYPMVIQHYLMRGTGAYSSDHGKMLSKWAAAFPGKKSRHAAQDFWKLFLGSFSFMGAKSNRPKLPQWGLEDNWLQPGVWSCWNKLVKNMSKDELLHTAKILCPESKDAFGWEQRAGFESHGYSRDCDMDNFIHEQLNAA